MMIHLFKFFIKLLLRLLFRVEVSGMENYEKAGDRVLIIANHTSLLDGVLLYAWLPETPTFAINTQIAAKKAFKPFLCLVRLFEMDAINPLSIKTVIKYIKQDNKVVIFPEGRITTSGTLMKIYEGTGLIADKSDANILPIRIEGAQFGRLSYMKGRGYVRWFPKITLTVLAPEKISIGEELKGHARRKVAARQLQDLLYKLSYSSFNQRTTLYSTLLNASSFFNKNTTVLEDASRETLTYKQIILRSILLSKLIKKQTLSGEHIGVLLPNVNALPVFFFALQFIGRIPAMLNFSAGALAVNRACETAQIKTIYTSRKFITQAKLDKMAVELEKNNTVIYLEDLKQEIGLFKKLSALIMSLTPAIHYARQNQNMNPDATAVILFTSGSEGHPKGVVLSHSNLLANYSQVKCHIYFNPAEIVFSCLPLFHSFGLNAGFLMPLFGGAKIFLYPTPLHYRLIPELIYQLGATIFFGTNTFFKAYARYAHPYDFNSLKCVVAGAEKLHEDTSQLWLNKYGIRIMQGYGVTEASPVISVNHLMLNKSGTVGRIIPGMEYYLRPAEGIDRGGHLVVKGSNIMQGYLLHGKEGKIQPPETERGTGWYDTGDIADIDEEGYITILGRAKRFAKVAGEMVSLSATEELAMLTWPNINHAAVAVYDERKGERIILITEKKDAERRPLLETARANQFGDLSIPRTVMVVDKIPVLGTGKTDYITLNKFVASDDNDKNDAG
ncbi:MAG TPA: acyl-[ACP]--phospholipid O-acyltransferase [Thiotrichaceae bacterium]|nr:acyl-[ACP]--phospholipid O-acyltransferase [Thiotrichaceae bacterium]HIM08754.1 acyl-[ACP]--phospholipid O-acyltransferase [Gammaproteobacteria bacterium]